MDYAWFVLPPHGRLGAIPACFNCATLCVQDVISEDFCIKFHIKSKCDGFLWTLVIVYGAAQDEHKPEFLAELVRICDNESQPMLVGVILILSDVKKKRIILILMLDALLFLMQ